METIFERVGALDVHKAQLTAFVRVPAPARRRAPQLAEFQTTVQGLLALRDRLAAYRSRTSRWRPPGCIGSRSGTCSRTTSS